MRYWISSFAVCIAIMACAASTLLISATPTRAAEDAAGIYLLGSKSSMAGVLPPPGTYFSSLSYFYTGDASGRAAAGVALDQIGNISLEANIDVDADAFIKIPTLLWVTPHKFLGGNIAFGVVGVVGSKDISVDVDALATLTLPNGTVLQRGQRFFLDDDVFTVGDPLVTAVIGWHQGNFHWNVAGLLNIPIGDYSDSDLANIAFNRWAFDITGAATWLDAAKGHELSAAVGFTFNGENPDTDYRTGTEFHVEFAAMKHFSQSFAAGVTGYHYDQITGDSGAGARLGSFKGKTTAIGPNINYNFTLGQTPVSTSFRWLHEFDVENRLEGDAYLFSAVIPLGIGGQATAPAK